MRATSQRKLETDAAPCALESAPRRFCVNGRWTERAITSAAVFVQQRGMRSITQQPASGVQEAPGDADRETRQTCIVACVCMCAWVQHKQHRAERVKSKRGRCRWRRCAATPSSVRHWWYIAMRGAAAARGSCNRAHARPRVCNKQHGQRARGVARRSVRTQPSACVTTPPAAFFGREANNWQSQAGSQTKAQVWSTAPCRACAHSNIHPAASNARTQQRERGCGG